MRTFIAIGVAFSFVSVVAVSREINQKTEKSSEIIDETQDDIALEQLFPVTIKEFDASEPTKAST